MRKKKLYRLILLPNTFFKCRNLDLPRPSLDAKSHAKHLGSKVHSNLNWKPYVGQLYKQHSKAITLFAELTTQVVQEQIRLPNLDMLITSKMQLSSTMGGGDYCYQSWESSQTSEKSYQVPCWTATTRNLQRAFKQLKILIVVFLQIKDVIFKQLIHITLYLPYER